MDRNSSEAPAGLILHKLRFAVGPNPPHKVRFDLTPLLKKASGLIATAAAEAPSGLMDDPDLVELAALVHQCRREPVEAVTCFARLADISADRRKDALVRLKRIVSWFHLGRQISALSAEILAKYPDEPGALEIYVAANGIGRLLALLDGASLAPAVQQHAVLLLLQHYLRQAEAKGDAGSVVDMLRFHAASGHRLDDTPQTQVTRLECVIVTYQLTYALGHKTDSDSRHQLAQLSDVLAELRVPTPAALVAALLKGKSRPDRINQVKAVVRSKYVWQRVYQSDEELKLFLVDELFQDAVARQRSSKANGNQLLLVLRGIVWISQFWADAEFRSSWCARIERALTDRDTVAGLDVMSRVRFIAGDIAGADRVFGELRKVLSATGARPASGLHTYVSPLAERYDPDLLTGHLRPEICGFRQVVGGQPEDGSGDRPVVVAAADTNYFRRYATRFMHSLRAADPDAAVHLHLIGDVADVDDVVQALTSFGGRFSLSVETPPIRMPYYYATCRFLRAAPLQAMLRCPLIILDIDLLFEQGPAAVLPPPAERADAIFRMNDAVRIVVKRGSPFMQYTVPRADPWTTVPAGYIFLNATTGGSRFGDLISTYSEMILEKFKGSGSPNWWIDQNIMFYVYMRVCMDRAEISFQNVEDFGVPWGFSRPPEPNLRRSIGRHPIFALPAPQTRVSPRFRLF